MPRCVGRSSAKEGGTPVKATDVFMHNNGVSAHFDYGGTTTVVTLPPDVDMLLDIAHQFLSAAQSIRESKQAKKGGKR